MPFIAMIMEIKISRIVPVPRAKAALPFVSPPITDGGWTTHLPALRARIVWAVHNLLDPPPGRFNLILCRNVLLYFSPETRAQVFMRLADALAPDGVLMLGAGETVLGQTDAFEPHPTLKGFYRRR